VGRRRLDAHRPGGDPLTLRTVAWAAVIGGLVAGSLAASPSEVTPRQAGGYWVLDADFHVHGFVGDGALAPWALRREAQRAGLEVFALTNHNQTITARIARRLTAASPGPIVLVGQEVTNRDYHISAVGIESTIDAEQPAARVIEDIHAQGGVAIANHPESVKYTAAYDDRALRSLDGFERTHPVIYASPATTTSFAAFAARVTAVNPEAAFIGSSDYHAGGTPGWCRTYVLARRRTAASVIEAVRDGRTVAADSDGKLFGPPEYVDLVRRAGGDRRPETNDWRATAASAVVWLGLLGVFVAPRHASRRT
jgi:hypothetical protein